MKQPNLIEDLKQLEAAEASKQVGDYDILVNSIAGGDEPDMEFVQRTLRAAGKTAADLERHVEMVRRIQAAQERATKAKAEDFGKQLLEATEQRAALKQEREDADREFKARDAELLDRIHGCRLGASAASRAVEELTENKRSLAAELRGEELPPEPVAPQPQFDVQLHSDPSATKKPKGYDAYSQDWERRCSIKGVISYWNKGVKVA